MVKITGWMELHGDSIICENCGEEILVSFNNCPYCGSSVDEIDEDDEDDENE